MFEEVLLRLSLRRGLRDDKYEVLAYVYAPQRRSLLAASLLTQRSSPTHGHCSATWKHNSAFQLLVQ